MRRLARLLLCLTLLGGGLTAAAPELAAQGRGEGADPLEEALERGDYELARKLAVRHDDVPSLLARAELAELAGRLDQATRFARVALEKAGRAEHRHAASLELARLQIARGELEAAEARLRELLTQAPMLHGARLELGRLLWSQGRRDEATPILEQFSTLYNNGNLKTSQDMLYLAQAMRQLGGFDDANYAFKEAYRLDARHPEVLVAWGELFLEKYNVADAHSSFEEALKINPRHPRALVGKAVVEMITSNQSEQVRVLLDEAAEVAPEHPELLLARGHLAIRDSDCEQARAHAGAILEDRPKHLEAITLGGICAYLDDDQAGFERARDRALAIHPTYAQFYAEVADYGVRAHRYVAAMELYQTALELDPGNAQALLGLGVGLSRINREDEAVEYLRRAFDADPYNVRAYNMLELYEKTMPRYSFQEYGRFRLRAHNEQYELVNMYVAPVVDDALEVFDEKYGFVPHKELSVEIYPNPTTFSVRSVGLPHITPHGICFGRVVTVRSPSDGNFNWRQVLWHELAHVYHLQLSNARVPRWFTEGLAEYETNVWDEAWQRHHDRELAIKVFEGKIPSVLELDHGFTHARSQVEVLRAYHLASLAVHFVAQTWGFDAIVAMLEAWGQNKDTEQVLQDVLGVDAQAFDQKLRAWLERRLLNFDGQLLYDFEALPARDELARRIKLNRLDAKAHAKMALVELGAGKIDEANESIQAALEITRADPDVLFAAMLLQMQQGKAREALEHGEAILEEHHDSYELRVILGQAAVQMEDIPGARVHLEAATELYAGGVQAWVALAQLAERVDDEQLYARATERLFMLNQHDPALARAHFERLEAAGELERAWQGLERWLDTNPFDPRVHRAIIALAPRLDRHDELARSWRALIALVPDERRQLYAQALESLRAEGLEQQAAALEREAAERGIEL